MIPDEEAIAESYRRRYEHPDASETEVIARLAAVSAAACLPAAVLSQRRGAGSSLPSMVSVDEAARMALDLPKVAEGERHGHRTWLVAGKAFACVRSFSKADLRRFGDANPPGGPILAVRVADLGEKEAVLAAQPKAFFTIPHFDGYSAVLIQLEVVTRPALREAIIDGWLACAPPKLADAYITREGSPSVTSERPDSS